MTIKLLRPEDEEHEESYQRMRIMERKQVDGSEYDEFGNDLYEIPEVMAVVSNNQLQDAPAPSRADEDSKIQALIDTPTLDWQQQNYDGFGGGRGCGRGMGGRMGGRGGFGWGGGGGFERKTPPPGNVCHRCKMTVYMRT